MPRSLVENAVLKTPYEPTGWGPEQGREKTPQGTAISAQVTGLHLRHGRRTTTRLPANKAPHCCNTAETILQNLGLPGTAKKKIGSWH